MTEEEYTKFIHEENRTHVEAKCMCNAVAITVEKVAGFLQQYTVDMGQPQVALSSSMLVSAGCSLRMGLSKEEAVKHFSDMLDYAEKSIAEEDSTTATIQ